MIDYWYIKHFFSGSLQRKLLLAWISNFVRIIKCCTEKPCSIRTHSLFHRAPPYLCWYSVSVSFPPFPCHVRSPLLLPSTLTTYPNRGLPACLPCHPEEVTPHNHGMEYECVCVRSRNGEKYVCRIVAILVYGERVRDERKQTQGQKFTRTTEYVQYCMVWYVQ